MTLWKRPLGIWVLTVWCAVQGLAGLAIGVGSHGLRSGAGWAFAAGHAFLLAGLILPFGPARYFFVSYLGLKIFGMAVGVWAIIFVAVSWGLRSTDLGPAASVFAYQLFLYWAFLYFWHPDTQAYLRGYINAPQSR